MKVYLTEGGSSWLQKDTTVGFLFSLILFNFSFKISSCFLAKILPSIILSMEKLYSIQRYFSTRFARSKNNQNIPGTGNFPAKDSISTLILFRFLFSFNLYLTSFKNGARALCSFGKSIPRISSKTSFIHPAIFIISFSSIPRVVNAGLPNLIPLG